MACATTPRISVRTCRTDRPTNLESIKSHMPKRYRGGLAYDQAEVTRHVRYWPTAVLGVPRSEGQLRWQRGLSPPASARTVRGRSRTVDEAPLCQSLLSANIQAEVCAFRCGTLPRSVPMGPIISAWPGGFWHDLPPHRGRIVDPGTPGCSSLTTYKSTRYHSCS
jgi:hypothetical protein